MQMQRFREKMTESIASVLPIALIVCLMCFSISPVSPDIMLAFLLGTLLLILGLALFNLGADNSMSLMGSLIGSRMTRSRKLWLIAVLSLVLGFLITIAEPDLQVLANNVPHIRTAVLVLTVSAGVGISLAGAMLRIFFSVPLKWILLAAYGAIFTLSFFLDPSFLSVAFDAGGVTTGPMTVPFIMAMGVGVASIRFDRGAEDDSFGLIALCSIGPVLSVMILGLIYPAEEGIIAAAQAENYLDTAQLGWAYIRSLPVYMLEMAESLGPILVFFLIFNFFALRLRPLPLFRILVGLAFTYAGLVVFLTGVNVGFSSLGLMLGAQLASGWTRFLLIPLAGVMGWFIVSAEPAVHVLTQQVEDISAGAISARAMKISLSVAIAFAMALAMVRVLTGIPILVFVGPGYAAALALSFFVPPIFTAIAFDSGGVASGPMTATFMLPFAMGACQAAGGNILTDAFGLVALVALMPLITIQVMGVLFRIQRAGTQQPEAEGFRDDEVIELWEVA